MRPSGSRTPGRAFATLLVGLACLLAAPASPQDGPPSFDVHAAAITVDAVVLDEHDQPVRGLRREDFTVLEDGRPQRLAAFEASRFVEAVSSVGLPRPDLPTPVASNEDPARRPGRVFALLVDDLGISAPALPAVRQALASWLSRADPADEITLASTSGDAWWSDRVDRGRAELLHVLARVRGRRMPRSGADAMSDWEAFRIAVHEQSTETMADPGDRSRPPDAGGSTRQGLQDTMHAVSLQTGSSTVSRVVQRWVDTGACHPCVDPNEMAMDCRELRVCSQYVQSRAHELHAEWLRRAQAVYGAVTRLSRSLAASPGRKAILLVSEELFEDSTLRQAARDAVDASQRANTAVYFLGARGLAGSSLFAADAEVAPRGQDVGVIGLEQGSLATAAAVALAEDTGGIAITTSNDLGSGLTLMSADASAYYLLGYQPERPPDGRWHSLEVRVSGRGLKVRARRRYLATPPGADPAAAPVPANAASPAGQGRRADGRSAGKRPLPPALFAGSVRGELPLRLAAYVQDPSDDGAVRVRIAVEIDNDRVLVDRRSTPWKAALDLTVMVATLNGPPVVPVDERLSLSLTADQVDSGWWLVPREVWLRPGVVQIRVFARDVASGASGLVTERLVVPDAAEAYVSTPLVTDRTLPPLRTGEPPRLVPTARRTFGRRPELFCQYEAFLFGGWNLPGVPQLFASQVLRRLDGTLVQASAPSPIDVEAGRAVRRISLPAGSLEDGWYELVVTVEDRLTRRTLAARTSFAVGLETRSAAAPGVPGP